MSGPTTGYVVLGIADWNEPHNAHQFFEVEAPHASTQGFADKAAAMRWIATHGKLATTYVIAHLAEQVTVQRQVTTSTNAR